MKMERRPIFDVAAWRDSAVDLLRLSEEHFHHARAAWVGQGFHNLQSEWFERQVRDRETLCHVRLFVYWEAPDDAPSMEQIFEWGAMGAEQAITELW